jgi:lysophospholipid acyltransferase (LPLAT)-like uncharacterized protein
LRKKLKTLKRKLLILILPTLTLGFIKLLAFSCKLRFYGEENLTQEPVIYALWHGELIMSPLVYSHKNVKNKPCSAIISQHFDGEIASRLVEKLNIKSIRGSSTRGSLHVLRESLRFIKKGGSVIITPDGPKGPLHSVADGVVSIAKIAKIKIVPINIKASSAWKLKSWDKMFIPKPFSTVEFFIGDPLDLSSLSKDEAKSKIRARMTKHVS